jgi:hypothetical protein
MSTQRWVFGLVLFALGCLVLVGGPVATAEEEKKPDAQTVKPNPAAEDAANIALAYRLADYGRQHKSPLELVTAASILRHIKALPGTEKATLVAPKDTEAPQDDPVKESPSLTEKAKSLLDEAKALVKADDASLNELIDRVQKQTTRGSLGGPRSQSRVLRPGFAHNFGVNFIGGVPATVAVTGNGIALFTVEAYNTDGVLVAASTARYPSITWVPHFTRHFTIRVRNDGGPFSEYTMYHN